MVTVVTASKLVVSRLAILGTAY